MLMTYLKNTSMHTKIKKPSLFYFPRQEKKVKKFLENTNLDTASKEFNESCKESFDIASKCITTGQQKDAVKFVNKAILMAQVFYEKFKDMYEKFVYSNEGIFVGVVVDKTIEEILEKKEVDRSWQEITRFNIQQKLKDIHNDTVKT